MSFAIDKVYTLPEIMRSQGPNGSTLKLIDVLSQQVPIVEEAYWERANGDTTHEMLRVSSEPTGTLVRYNEGTPNSAATSVPIMEPMCRLEDRLQIDTRILDKAADPIEFRRSREATHFRGLIKTFHSTIFGKNGYGARGADMRSIDGLTTRMNAIALNSVMSNGGAVANMASIWIIKWGTDGVFLTYPQNMSKMLSVTDLREQPAYDAAGNRYEVVMTKFGWDFGLNIADARAVKRLCNINVTPGSTVGSFGNDTNVAKGEENMIDLIETLPMGDTSNTAIYVGPQVMAAFRKRFNAKGNLFFDQQDVWGRKQLTFQGIPVIRVDTLGADESTIS